MDHIEEITGEGFLMDSKELVTVRKRGSNAIKKHIWNTYFHQIPINNHLTISIPDIPLILLPLFLQAGKY